MGIISQLTPTVSAPDVHEVTHALELIRRKAEMPPGELRLLSYLVEETLAGRGVQLHQRTIAADVFGRDLRTFDPRADSIVRKALIERLQMFQELGFRPALVSDAIGVLETQPQTAP